MYIEKKKSRCPQKKEFCRTGPGGQKVADIPEAISFFTHSLTNSREKNKWKGEKRRG